MTVEDNIILDTKNIDLRALGVPKEREAEAREMLERHVESYDEKIAGKMSAPGTLDIPIALEKRRLQWLIPDAAIRAGQGALYDRVLLFQIDPIANSPEEAKRLGSGLLWKPDTVRSGDRRAAPRAVLVGAGLGALDALRAHCVGLGHIVYFCKNVLYTIPVEEIGGEQVRLSIARVGDFISSEDLARAFANGDVRVETVERKDDNGVTTITHYYVDREGRMFCPTLPDPGDML